MNPRFERLMTPDEMAPLPNALYRHRRRGYTMRIVVFSRRRNFVKLLHGSPDSPIVWSGTIEQFWADFLHAEARHDEHERN